MLTRQFQLSEMLERQDRFGKFLRLIADVELSKWELAL